MDTSDNIYDPDTHRIVGSSASAERRSAIGRKLVQAKLEKRSRNWDEKVNALLRQVCGDPALASPSDRILAEKAVKKGSTHALSMLLSERSKLEPVVLKLELECPTCHARHHRGEGKPRLPKNLGGTDLARPGIYSIKCSGNGKIYVGSSRDIKNRFKQHLTQLYSGKHFNNHLQNAWNKYGPSSFVFEVVDLMVDEDKLVEREMFWVESLGAEFNLQLFEKGKVYAHSEETKKKIGDAHRGSKRTPEQLERYSEAQRGKIVSAETRQRLGAAASKVHADKLRPAVQMASLAVALVRLVAFDMPDAIRVKNDPGVIAALQALRSRERQQALAVT